MQHIRKLICVMLSVLIVMSTLAGCAEEETEEENKFLVCAAVCDSVDSFDPAMNVDGRTETIFYALYENLMRTGFDEAGNAVVEPGVAKEYEEVQNFDGTVDYVFTLRPTARWSDGTRVKAKDFAYAWRRLADPAFDTPNCEYLSMVEGYEDVRTTGDTNKLAVKAESDSVFRVTLSAPCPYFLSDICTAAATMPLRSERVSRGEGWAKGVDIPCNGPYQVSSREKDYVQLRRNTLYYDSRSAVPDMLRLYFVRNADEAQTLYDQGVVDCAVTQPGREDAAVYPPLRTVDCVFYNHMSDVFSNAHVRRAFELTLDRTAIAAAAGPGMRPATGLVPDGITGNGAPFRDEVDVLCAVDEEKYAAHCLEAENEMRLGGFWGGIGFPEVSCIYPADGNLRTAVESVVSGWNEKLRLNLKMEALDREEYNRRITEGEYELAIDRIAASYNDAACYLSAYAGTDGSNALHYVNKPFDLLIAVARSSADPAARTAILHDAEALLLEDTALSPLYFGSGAYLLRDTLSGLHCDWRGACYFTAVAQTEPQS